MIVRLQENLPETGLSNWIIFEVEFVKAVEGILMRMHIQSIY